MEVLQLNDNLIAEHFGENFSKLLALDILYLQNNRISGILPESLFDLKQLRRLNVSNNELRGCIPDNIGNMTNLESFLLSNNCIVGPVPLSINNLTKLRDFHVFRPFPAEFTMPSKAFDKKMFDRIYSFAPEVGINSMHWDYKVVYGRKREDNDNESIAIFSGKL